MTTCRFSLEPISDPSLFFGRQQIVDDVRTLMTSGPSPDFVVIHGAQKIGRTSLLKYLERRNLELPRSDVQTCFIDLRLWSLVPQQEVVVHFASVLRQLLVGSRPEPTEQPSSYLFDQVLQDLAQRPELRLVLLMDRADDLLGSELQRTVVSLLGMLNDGVPNLGIVLSFGASQRLSSEHVLDRMRKVEDAIREISPLWTRAQTRVLGTLCRADSVRFLRAAGAADLPDGQAQLTEDELAWVIQMTGDHPFLLNRLGLSVCRFKAGRGGAELRADERLKLERELEKELRPLVQAVVQRLTSNRRGHELLSFAQDLASGSMVKRSIEPASAYAEAVDILAGEGLVQLEDAAGNSAMHPLEQAADRSPYFYWMPSKALRNLLIDRRSLQLFADHAPGRKASGPAPVEQAGRMEVIITDDRMPAAAIALTDIERRILRRFLESPGALLGVEELVKAVWGHPPDPESELRWRERLKQRLTALRRKLAPHTLDDPIINVYGQGYRLAAPERFSLDN